MTVRCQCGCGKPAPIAQENDARRGRVKGQPQRFRSGHQAKTRPRTPAEIRFWRNVNGGEIDQCWVWTGYRRPGGYGVFMRDRADRVGAHVFAYEHLIGPVPEGLDLDHLCRNTSCVNPWHLEPVTRAINVSRAHRARTAEQGENAA